MFRSTPRANSSSQRSARTPRRQTTPCWSYSAIAEGANAGQKFYAPGEKLWRSGDAARGIPACMACHGAAGHGNPGPPYPAIGGQHASYTQKQLEAFRAGTVYGKDAHANSVMAGVAKYLTDEDIRSLAAYVQGLHEAGDPTASP